MRGAFLAKCPCAHWLPQEARLLLAAAWQAKINLVVLCAWAGSSQEGTFQWPTLQADVDLLTFWAYIGVGRNQPPGGSELQVVLPALSAYAGCPQEGAFQCW